MVKSYKSIVICIMLSLFACGAYADTEINLSGTWEYCIINSEHDYPPADGSEWNKVQLPNRKLFEIIANKRNITRGYILYRKTVTIDNKPADNLVFQAGEIMNTDMVFINGKKIGETGIFPPFFRSGWAKFRNYPVPQEYLLKGENRIDIITYFDAELWIISPLRIVDKEQGNYEYMVKNFLQIEFIHSFCVLLLSFSILFISIYLKRKKEVMYFYYAATTFFLADMMILQFIENVYTYIPLSSDTIFKICAVGLIFVPPFIALFFRTFLGMAVTRRRLVLYLSLPFMCTLFMLLSQDRYYIIYWRNIYLLLIPLYIVDIVYVSISQLVAGNKKGLMLFVALIPIFIFGIYDILVFSLYAAEGGVPLYPLGVPLMMILIGLQLVNRFIFNLNTAEELNILLQEKMEEGKRLARLENEISIARKIQLANVPHSLPELTGFNIGVKYIPAENISGDFYNFHAFEEERLGLLIADVSGHGIPASLITSMVKILFSTLTPVYSNPDLFIQGLNTHLFDKMEGNLLTAGYCYISRAEKKVHYARAGHEPLLHISRKNGVAVLNEYMPHGRLIGVNSSMDLELVDFEIDHGDRIVAYTDGLIEAFNGEKEMFGLERLKTLLMKSRDFSIDEAIEFIFNELQGWRSFRQFDDDFTLIIIDIG